MMKRYPYTDEQTFRIFKALNRRGLAMFLGMIRGEPMIWLDGARLPYRKPITIATAEMLLDEITTLELEGRTDYEVMVGEVLDGAPVRRRSLPRLALVAGGAR